MVARLRDVLVGLSGLSAVDPPLYFGVGDPPAHAEVQGV